MVRGSYCCREMNIRLTVLLLFLALMTGCTTVYQPVPEPATVDYFLAEDSVVTSAVRYGSGFAPYTEMGLYPWGSMDYFYLGHHPYTYWRSAYYSPYFSPHHYPAWRPS